MATKLYTTCRVFKYVQIISMIQRTLYGREKCSSFDETFPISDKNRTSRPQKDNFGLVHNCPDNKVEQTLSNKISENIF